MSKQELENIERALRDREAEKEMVSSEVAYLFAEKARLNRKIDELRDYLTQVQEENTHRKLSIAHIEQSLLLNSHCTTCGRTFHTVSEFRAHYRDCRITSRRSDLVAVIMSGQWFANLVYDARGAKDTAAITEAVILARQMADRVMLETGEYGSPGKWLTGDEYKEPTEG